MTPGERGWVLAKSALVMDACVTNMRAARDLPYAFRPHRGSRSGMFVCVGAGPSLTTTGPELARLQREGAVVCTVNTALSAVNRYVVPDVVLAREVVDVSSHLEHPAGLRVLDLGASPKVWDVARSRGPCAWFIPGALQYFELAREYEARPLFGGPAAMTALVALVAEWGAASVVLVGCDLALAEDGTSYAAGSAFSGQRAVIGADGIAVNGGEGFAVKQAQHAAGGVDAWPEREGTVVIERYGGGQIRTTTQWYDQVPWLGDFCARNPDIACIDATGAGARKPWWKEFPTTKMLGGPGTRLPVVDALPPEAHDRALAHVLAQCETAWTVADNVVHPEGTVVMVPRLLEGCDVVDAAAAGELLRVQESGASVVDKVRAAYGTAWPEAAQRVRRLAVP